MPRAVRTMGCDYPIAEGCRRATWARCWQDAADSLTEEVRVSRLDRSRHRCLLYLTLAVCVCCAHAGLASADEQADRLRLRALIEEGDLILEEAAALSPAADRLAAEGAQLDAAEAALRAEQTGLNDAIARFNAQNVELERLLKEHRAKCSSGSDDAALIEACNARATEFNAAAQAHETQRPALQARQRELPGRIAAQNAARREWALNQREQEPKLQASHADAEYWLGSARTFLTSEPFRAMARNRGAPAACSSAALGDLAAPPAMAALARAQACLKAVAGTLN